MIVLPSLLLSENQTIKMRGSTILPAISWRDCETWYHSLHEDLDLRVFLE
jgi:hypothetical protein